MFIPIHIATRIATRIAIIPMAITRVATTRLVIIRTALTHVSTIHTSITGITTGTMGGITLGEPLTGYSKVREGKRR